MDIPGLPTDNLYKLLAIGSMLAWGSLWFWLTKRNEALSEQLHKGNLAVRQHQLAVEHLRADLPSALDDPGVTRRSRELALKELELEAQQEYLKGLQGYVSVLNRRGRTLMTLSGGLTVVAYVLWYHRVQTYQDESTVDAAREQKAKADLAELELAKASRAARHHHR